MAHHDVVENNPKKEVLTALIGIVLLLTMIAGIAVFAWLRPAGDHYPATATPEVTEQAQVAPTPEAGASANTATAETAATPEATSAPAAETTGKAADTPADNPDTTSKTEEAKPAENTATAEAPKQ